MSPVPAGSTPGGGRTVDGRSPPPAAASSQTEVRGHGRPSGRLRKSLVQCFPNRLRVVLCTMCCLYFLSHILQVNIM